MPQMMGHDEGSLKDPIVGRFPYTARMPEGRSLRQRFLRGLLILVAVIVAIRILSPYVANGYANWLVVSDEFERADVAVALSGADGERLLAAIELYKEGKVDRILIVGPPVPILKVYTGGEEGLTQGEAKRRIAVRKGVREEDIMVDLRASSTFQEAETVADVAGREGWNAVVIVTSPLHTHRARSTFRKVLHDELGESKPSIFMHHLPIGRSSQDPKDWWNREAESIAVATETFKMVFYAHRYRIFPWS